MNFVAIDELKCNPRQSETMAALLASGNVTGLNEYIERETQVDRDFLLGILVCVLNCECASEEYLLSVWLLEHKEVFPTDKDFLDLCLLISVYLWREDAVSAFLELGANPNQKVLNKRNIFDVCLNRLDHYYSGEKKELEDAVLALRKYGAKTYVEEKYQENIANNRIFDFVATYDSWVEIA